MRILMLVTNSDRCSVGEYTFVIADRNRKKFGFNRSQEFLAVLAKKRRAEALEF